MDIFIILLLKIAYQYIDMRYIICKFEISNFESHLKK